MSKSEKKVLKSMAENNEKKGVDLSSLTELDFTPNWDNKKSKSENLKTKVQTRKFKAPISKELNRVKPKIFNLYQLVITPDTKVLSKLKNQIRKTGISYSMDEISSTISSKLERIQIKIEHLEDKKEERFYETNFDGFIFNTKRKAIEHIMNKGLSSIVTIYNETNGTPNGNYITILKCPVTDKLLPPKSFHNFKDIVNEHLISNKISNNYENYVAKLVVVDDLDTINQWKETPLSKSVYCLKKYENNEKKFNSLESLANYIEVLKTDQFIKSHKFITVREGNVMNLEKDLITYMEDFMKSSNKWKKDLFFNILINLKKSGFHIFKYGVKNHLYATGIKPKSIQLSGLSDICVKITKLINSTKAMKKGEVLNSIGSQKVKKDFILNELKWLVREGYVREFSNGTITVN
ncbi:MAG: hypothetical protein QNL65_00375 [Opitutales bacterium]